MIAGRRVAVLFIATFVAFGIGNWVLLGVEMVEASGMPPSEARYGQDLRAIIGAGDIAAERDGSSLYDDAASAYTDIDAASFFYPPWFATMATGISWIPFHILYPLWTLVGMALLGLAIRGMGVERWVVVTGATWLAVPTFTGIFFGQISNLMAFGLGMAFLAIAGSRPAAAGTAFALLAVKPHLLLGFVIAWLADLRRWWRLVGFACAATAVLVVVSEVWMPGAWSEFVHRILETEPLASPEREVSLLGGSQLLVALAEPIGTILAIVLGVGVLAVAAVVSRNEGVDVSGVLAVALIASLLVAPHSLAYDWVLLIPPFVFLVRRGLVSAEEALGAGFVVAMSVPIGFLATDLQLTLSSFAIHLPTWTLLALFVWTVRRVRAEGRRSPEVEA